MGCAPTRHRALFKQLIIFSVSEGKCKTNISSPGNFAFVFSKDLASRRAGLQAISLLYLPKAWPPAGRASRQLRFGIFQRLGFPQGGPPGHFAFVPSKDLASRRAGLQAISCLVFSKDLASRRAGLQATSLLYFPKTCPPAGRASRQVCSCIFQRPGLPQGGPPGNFAFVFSEDLAPCRAGLQAISFLYFPKTCPPAGRASWQICFCIFQRPGLLQGGPPGNFASVFSKDLASRGADLQATSLLYLPKTWPPAGSSSRQIWLYCPKTWPPARRASRQLRFRIFQGPGLPQGGPPGISLLYFPKTWPPVGRASRQFWFWIFQRPGLPQGGPPGKRPSKSTFK